ncbi:hypothetical protein XH79_09625 [Bradyrhizobium sp. CCBAU 45389]|nr:hypothetical protein [Bradyrhizobium sp. CCBAU 45389]
MEIATDHGCPIAKDARRTQRYRRLHAEATDPLAVRLLQDIIAELEASLPTEEQDTGKKADGG